MTRKQLPKAIRRTAADLRMVAAEADIEAQTPQIAQPHELIEEPAVLQPLPPANDSLPATAALSASLAARRRLQATRIVERHKMYAAVGGLFPMPAVNVAGVTAIILRMVKSLSDLYHVPFERDQTRSIVLGLMGGAAPTGLAAVTASTLAFVVPASGLFGLAVSSVTAASLTRGIGMIVVERLEKGEAG